MYQFSPNQPTPHVHITPGDLHLWVIDEQEVIEAGVIDNYPALLSEAEQRRMQSQRSSDRKRQFLIGRAALRSILACYIPDSAPAALAIDIDGHGKPALRCDEYALHFSLSHSHHKILIGITKQRQIGVDIEFMRQRRDVQRIADHFFHPNEWNNDLLQQDRDTGAHHALRFYQLWTLKEAFIKAEGKGLAIPTDAFYFNAIRGSHPELVVTASDVATSRPWRFAHQFIADDYSVAVAFEDVRQAGPVTIQSRRYIPLSDAAPFVPW